MTLRDDAYHSVVIADADGQPLPARQALADVPTRQRDTIYRWNPERRVWQFWHVRHDCWCVSGVWRRESERRQILAEGHKVQEYEETWCEPEEYSDS